MGKVSFLDLMVEVAMLGVLTITSIPIFQVLTRFYESSFSWSSTLFLYHVL